MQLTGEHHYYYHLNRSNRLGYPPFKVGDVIDIGEQVNPYHDYILNQRKTYTVTTETDEIPVPGFMFFDLLRLGEVNCPNPLEVACDFAEYCMNYARELTLEIIRRQEFPHLPSRRKCIWLLSDESNIRYWCNALQKNDEHFQLTRLQVRGHIHETGSEHLLQDMEPVMAAEEAARRYWRGSSAHPERRETIFVGRIKVVEILDYTAFL